MSGKTAYLAGLSAEDQVARLYETHGYHLRARRWRGRGGEIDLIFEKSGEITFVEVKNVSMKEGDYALFPDAVTTRGQKHLKTLIEVKKKGIRAVMLYVIQRSDVGVFAPAKAIDPNYAEMLKEAYNKGVEIIPIG